MLKVPCSACGKPCYGGRCDEHPRSHRSGRHSRSRQQRGYDAEYDRNRRIVVEAARARGDACVLCGQPFGPGDVITAEHIVPLRQGGTSDLGNLGPAHSRCNFSRRRRVWRQ